MTREQIARDIAVMYYQEYVDESKASEMPSEKAMFMRVAMRYLKSAAELDKGNTPRHTSQGWIVESRSTFIGKPVSLVLKSGTIIQLDGDKEVELRFAVTSGDVFFVNLDKHECSCASHGDSCWHVTAVECYVDAGEQFTTEEMRNEAMMEILLDDMAYQDSLPKPVMEGQTE